MIIITIVVLLGLCCHALDAFTKFTGPFACQQELHSLHR
jgi:hypothetical protein